MFRDLMLGCDDRCECYNMMLISARDTNLQVEKLNPQFKPESYFCFSICDHPGRFISACFYYRDNAPFGLSPHGLALSSYYLICLKWILSFGR